MGDEVAEEPQRVGAQGVGPQRVFLFVMWQGAETFLCSWVLREDS